MIKFNDVSSQWSEIESAVTPDLLDLLRNGPYIKGQWLNRFERMFAESIGNTQAVGVGNGTDGLRLAIAAVLEKASPVVVVPANGHISDAMSATVLNCGVIFADCDEYGGLDPESARAELRNQAGDHDIPIIIAAHMCGQPCDIIRIKDEFKEFPIIEDCSQAYGATVDRVPVGSFGIMSVFSLYPTKNLGAFGDGGVVVSNDAELIERVIKLREYGSFDRVNYEEVGWNSRLDEIQALVLCHKIPLVQKWIETRRLVAREYFRRLEGVADLALPTKRDYSTPSTYHLFQIRTGSRDALKVHLESKGIPTMIHYPLALPQTKAYFRGDAEVRYPNACRHAKENLSLPIHQYMTEEQIKIVADAIKGFFHERK